MSTLARFFYPVPARRSVPGIIAWWERRRLGYNIVVGATGLLSLGIVSLFSVLPPATHFAIPWIAPIVFGVMANICYSLGWAVESLFHVVWREEVQPVGPVLFRQGVLFAVGVTLLPVVIAGIGWVARVVSMLF
ncbi:MAG: hypothetical protein ABI647_09965 [Gemmatimonadota bacterium]